MLIKLRREKEIKEEIQLGARRSRNAIQLQDDYSVWITQKEGNKNSIIVEDPVRRQKEQECNTAAR